MKRLVSIVLTLALAVTLAVGCGPASSEELWASNNKQRVDDFFEKYKRGDIDTLKEKAVEFLRDFRAIKAAEDENADSIIVGWEKHESEIAGTTYVDYTKDVVLFNQGCKVEASCYEYTSEDNKPKKMLSLSLEFETGNAQNDYNIGQIMFDAMTALYGDAKEIHGDMFDDPISEAELRRIFSAGEPSEWSADWDEGIIAYFYSNILTESSSLSIY